MKIAGGLIIGLTTICGLLVACATHPPLTAAPCRPTKAYQGSPTWEDIVKDAQRVKSLSATVEINFSQGSTGRLKGLLVYQSPDWLRFEVLSPWGQPSAYFILKGPELSYFNFGDNRLLLGRANGSLIKEFLGLEVRPSWLFSLFNGRGWVVQGNPQILGTEELKGGRKFYLHYSEETFQEGVFWDELSGEVKEVTFVAQRDSLEVRAQFEDILCSSSINFPKKINLSTPSGWQAQMTFTQLEINSPLEPSLFETPGPREGMKVYYLN